MDRITTKLKTFSDYRVDPLQVRAALGLDSAGRGFAQALREDGIISEEEKHVRSIEQFRQQPKFKQ